MGLKVSRKTREIKLPSGPRAIVKNLIGKHQRLLTEQGKNIQDKLNEMIAEVLQKVDGIDFSEMQPYQKIKFVESMLSADRRYILTEARQLSQGAKTTFIYHHEWKDSDGAKKSEQFEIHLIDEDNRDKIVENIKEMFCKEGEEESEHDDHIEEMNKIGGFPAKPYLKTYEDYNEVIANKDVIFGNVPNLEEYEFIFSMLDGKLEKKINIKKVNSHHAFLSRQLRYREISGDEHTKPWRKVTMTDLDGMPTETLDFFRDLFREYEGEIDSVEIIDNPDPNDSEKKLNIDLMSQVSFFFPSGRV